MARRTGASEIGYTRVSTELLCAHRARRVYPGDPSWEQYELRAAPADDPAGRRWVGVRVSGEDGEYREDDPNGAAFFGTLIHEGMSEGVFGRDHVQPMKDLWADNLASEITTGFFAQSDAPLYAAIEVVERLLAMELLGSRDLTPLAAETSLWAPTPSGLPYCQRADLLVRDVKGRVWVLDWKTTSMNHAYAKWLIDGQMEGFAALGQANYGENYAGHIIVQVNLTRSNNRLRQVDVHVVPVSAPSTFLEETVQPAYQSAQEGRDVKTRNPAVCAPYNRECPFRRDCYGGEVGHLPVALSGF